MPDNGRKNELLYRVYSVLFVFFLLVLLIGYRIIKISVIEGDEWRAKIESRSMVYRPLDTQRGNIYADDGQNLLATSVEFFEIRMDPVVPSKANFAKYINGLANGLAKYDDRKTAREWKDYIVNARGKNNRYILIAKHVGHDGMQILKNLPLFELGKYKGGLIKNISYERERPYRNLAARTIGVDREKHRVGLEHSFNRLLRGDVKNVLMKRISENDYMPVQDPTDYEIVKGKDIVTTIDINIQDIVHNELLRGIEEHDGEGGTAILMEVATGEIKAISNLSRSKYGALGEFHNFAVADRSEPGSTMKAASVLALLEDGYADSETIVDFSRGMKNFYGLKMHDSGNHGVSHATLKEAFEKSSNVGIASAMDEAYNKTKKWSHYVARLKQFGLTDLSGIELEGERKPLIKDPKKNKKEWYNTTIPWMAHGYEMEMTPLQVLKFYNAIANNGKLMEAQLVKSIISDGGVEKSFAPRVSKESIAKPENIRELQVMLEGVVERGTGINLKSKNYKFAGKTGTTKVDYGTDDPKYNASFAGYWPAENPKYSMIVVVFGLRGEMYYGNRVAGPIFKRIVDWCHAIKHDTSLASITPDDFKGDYKGKVYGYADDYSKLFGDLKIRYIKAGRWIKGQSGEEGEVLNGKAKISTNTVPDLKGMGLRDAVYVLENLGMKVNADGFGKVSRQSLKPGATVGKKEITIYLN
ncbi:MAG: cell division protein FtsI (penicillin-binding protein 3) [Saprospiraceae bacterium]|jgi:cell division protein FtsI (penicillin-binding protein 3)